MRSFFKTYRIETTFFLISFVLHLAVSLFLSAKFGGDVLWFENEDAHSYLNLAHEIVSGNGFSRDGVPSAYRTPVYPLFLAGVSVLPGSDTWAILLVQNIIASIAGFLIYRIGTLFFSRRVGWIAAALYLVEPYMLMTANLATTETFFNFLLILALFCFGRFLLDSNRFRYLSITGVLLGLLALTRPVALYLPIGVVCLLIIQCVPKKQWTVCLKRVGLVLGLFFLVLSPWMARQYHQFHRLRITNIDSFMLFARVAPIVVMHEEGMQYIPAATLNWQRFEERTPGYTYLDVINTFTYYDVLVHDTKELVKSDPWYVARFYAISAVPAMFGTGYEYMLEDVVGVPRPADRPSYTEVLVHDGAPGLFRAMFPPDIFQITLFGSLLLWLCIYLIILRSLFNRETWRQHLLPLLLLLGVSAYFIFFTLGPAGHVRYRMPSFPSLFLLVAFGLDFLLDRGILRRTKE